MTAPLRSRRIRLAFRFPAKVAVRVLGALSLECLTILAMMAALSASGPGQVHAQATVPNGFRDSLVVAVDSPTDLTFTPGGRLVVATQPGVLYLLSSGSLIPVLDLSAKTCSDFERGMLGVAFDPLFSSNHYIYVYYTYAKFGGCADNSTQSPVNRVSRFVMRGNTADPASEVVLLDNMLSLNGNHNGGDLLFGKDGYLYVSIGDSGCELNNPTHCGGQNGNARKQNYLTGKVLRITRNGGIPAGNPFTGSDSGRCNVNGKTSAAKCQETYLWGLRNPFRMALDPNSQSTKIYVNDVGQDTWEEIDQAVAGSDYGWNVREGFCANGSTTDCGTPPSGMRNPIFAYQHGTCNSITGGAFVPAGVWPATYDSAYFYADYVCGQILMLKNGGSTVFASNAGPVTGLQFGPYGTSQALYYASYAGEIRRITTNRNPVAAATASPTYGLTPLDVTFDGRASSDPDGDALSYRWDFKDGSPLAAGSQITHTFQQTGDYAVSLTVKDTHGGSDTTSVVIHAGNTPPDVDITSPLASDLFSVGQTIALDGSATDAQDNTPITYRWDVRLHHDTHEHPLHTFTTQSAEFTAPAPEDLAAAGNSYLVITLTATDSTGLSASQTINLMPRTVNVTVAADQPGAYVNIEGTAYTAPKTVLTWAGNPLDLEAPDQVLSTGEPVDWTSWSVAGGQAFQYVAPSANSTVTAHYAVPPGPIFGAAADARVKESAPNGNEGSGTGLSTRGGTTSDYETLLRFDVSGINGPVQSAVIYLYAYDGTEDGPSIYTASSSWSESTVTWKTRPASSGGALDNAGAIPTRTWFTLDVTSAVTGNGSFNFVLRQPSSDTLSFRSREASTQQPRLVVVTGAGSGDTIAPSVPSGLAADAPTSSTVVVTWNAASDDAAVAGYELFRNGTLYRFTTDPQFTESGLKASTKYTYAVRAIDTSGNRSPLTGSVAITTPAPTQSTTMVASADAYVVATSPSTNFGARTTLRVDNDPATETYLKFKLSGIGGNIYRATVRIFVPAGSGNGTNDGPVLFRSTSGWTESSVTWSSKPASTGSAQVDTGAIGNGVWVEYDVTALIPVGGTTVSFGLIGESSDVVVFSSREGATPPQLVVTYFATSAASAADDAGTAATAEPTASPAAATPTPAASPQATAVATPVIPFADDFESGDLSRWTSVDGLETTSAAAHGGAWSAVAQADGSDTVAGNHAAATLELGGDERELYVSAWIAVEHVGTDGVDLVTFLASDNRPLLTLIVDGDHLSLRNEKTGRVTPVAAVADRGWHEVQIHLTADGNHSSVEVWFDRALVYRARQPLNARPVTAVRLGATRTDRSYLVGFDDVRIDRICIGVCSADLVTPTPTATPTTAPNEATEAPPATATPEPTREPTATATTEPTEQPTDVPTATTEPTEPPTPEPSSADTDSAG